MNPQLKMLLWKDWRERRGQLLSSLVLLALCILGALLWTSGRHLAGAKLEAFCWEEMAMLYVFFVPVLVAMRTACGENTDHSGPFTTSLPLARGRASGVRLFGGALVLAAPLFLLAVLATIAFALAWPLDSSLPGRLPALMPASWSGLAFVWFDAAVLALAAVGCYVQFALLGTFVQRENQLAFLGAVWTILSFFGVVGHEGLAETISPHGLLMLAVSDSSHGPHLLDVARGSRAVAGNLALVILFSALFISRHGRRILDPSQESAWSRARQKIGRLFPVWLPWPLSRIRRTRWGALAWLAMRQSLPMCLAALALSLAITAMLWVKQSPDLPEEQTWKAAASIWTLMTAMLGIFWASVVGVGSVADELDRRSADFWRTRPIPFWRLLTIKFLIGLVVVAVVLNGPLAVVCSFATFALDTLDHLPSDWVYIACVVPVQSVMFAQALAWACLLRRVALGAMAALCTMFVVLVAQIAIPALQALAPLGMYRELLRDAKSRGGPVDLSTCGYPATLAVLALATLASYLIAGYALSTYQPRHPLGQSRTPLRFPRPGLPLRLRRSA